MVNMEPKTSTAALRTRAHHDGAPAARHRLACPACAPGRAGPRCGAQLGGGERGARRLPRGRPLPTRGEVAEAGGDPGRTGGDLQGESQRRCRRAAAGE